MISSTYLPTLIQKFKILEVAGCCDANEEAAIRTAERFGLQAMTPEELLADESIELVRGHCLKPKDVYKRQGRLSASTPSTLPRYRIKFSILYLP